MNAARLKSYMPRSLYGRAALILVLPVIMIQLVVSVVFIQRHFDGVTRQMSASVALEVRALRDETAEAGDADAARLAATLFGARLGLETDWRPAPSGGDRRPSFDLTGRRVIEVMRDSVPGIIALDLAEDERRVILWLETRHGTMETSFARSRVSATNPHQLLVLMIGTSVLMTMVAFLYLRNQLRPIKRLARAASAFGRGQNLPYSPSGATEVRAAGHAFLEMRARIERHIEQRTLMLSGVSHDLRTPLTRFRLSLGMMEEGPEVAALRRDVEDMERMLDAFLDFARGDSVELAAPADPAEIAARAIEDARRAGQDVTLKMVPPAPGAPATWPSLRAAALGRALANLLGNAARHGTRARLSVSSGPRWLRFTVEDDGPGIPETQRDAALRPFVRLDTARNQDHGGGVGLGLAIAADVARAHGGSLRLSDSADLGGLRVDLMIPI